MPSTDGEFQFTERLGQEITGKMLRPHAFESVSAFSLDTGVFATAIAITIFPAADDPEFKERIVILLSEDNVELFIRTIRLAQAGAHPVVRKEGTA
jgi:hypothetical protein